MVPDTFPDVPRRNGPDALTDAEKLAPQLERLFAGNERYAERFDIAGLGAAPLLGLAIVSCMDARMSIEDIFGLRPGDAHVIRNAGAVASDDVIRSLVLSQQVLGSRAVIVLGHTGCGLNRLAEDELRLRLSRETGQESDIRFGAFADLDEHVAAQVARITGHPWLRAPALGLVYEVDTGRVRRLRKRSPG